ncbi:helix-turn-helix domain-containing protein [Candidatus Oleimmundimicrobium sp.]|uniref:helix-turn-helix domain-containing protein n=1 Tax=Candidatus Oleimmundimicrobium sp. TaxID=3060597 RepID=UPI00271EE127|nr:helix-turn-helix domain-containing protein [Candidatus Oleimmundimicrobium sp.]MDO8885308.1 helix-turn-helix domain-containing protein [Candidatus Oleimmundimicrobium sp.]
MEKENKLYTPKQVAEKLNLKPTTIREWCKTGKIGRIKFGKEYRISEKDIEDWISKRKKQFKPDKDLLDRNLLCIMLYLNLKEKGESYIADLYRAYKEESTAKSIYYLDDILDILNKYDEKMPGLTDDVFKLLRENGFLKTED